MERPHSRAAIVPRGDERGTSRRLVPPRAVRPLVPPLPAALLVAALLTSITVTPLAPFAADPYRTEHRLHLLLGSVIVAYVLLLLAQRRGPPRTGLDLPIAAVLVTMAAGVAGSLDRRVSAEWVLTVLPVVPVFYVLADRRLLPDAAVRRGAQIAAVIAAILALRSVWEQWSGWLTLVRAVDGRVDRAMLLPPTMPRVANVGSHPNILAAVFAITAPAFLLTITDRRSRPVERAAASGGLVVVLAALFFTLSRAGWAATAAGLVVTGLGIGAAAGYRPRAWKPWLAGAVALGLVLIVVAGAFGRARPDWLFRDSLNPRADMRRVGIEIFRDNPLTGSGPGLYVSLYPRHHGGYPFAAVHSHNAAIQIAADYGAAGLAAAALMLVAVSAVLLRAWRRGSRRARAAAASAAGAVVAFLVHGLADSPHLFPEVLLMLAAVLALTLGADVTPRTRSGRGDGDGAAAPGARRLRVSVVKRASVPALLLTLSLVLLPGWWYVDRAQAAHAAGVAAAARGQWDTAVSQEERAVARDPWLAAYRFQLAAALGARYRQRGVVADRDRAIRAYEDGLARNPYNGAAWADLASLRLDAGDSEGASAAITALSEQAGRDMLLELAQAVLVQRTEDAAHAIDTYAGLLAIDPTLALTPFWRDDDFRRANYDAIVDRALERAEEITGAGNAAGLQAAIRLFSGHDAPRLDDPAAVAAARGDVTREVALARLLTKDGQTAGAEPLLRDAVARKGDSPDARAALGDWYAARGNVANARRQWLAAAYLGDVGAGDALGRSYDPGPPPAALVRRQRALVDGVWNSRFYLPFQNFRFTFLRHEPVPIVGPGDWLDALPDDLPAWQADVERWQAGTAGGR